MYFVKDIRSGPIPPPQPLKGNISVITEIFPVYAKGGIVRNKKIYVPSMRYRIS